MLLSSCNILGSPSSRSTNQDTALEDVPSQDLGVDESVDEDEVSLCGDDHLSPSEICEGFDLRCRAFSIKMGRKTRKRYSHLEGMTMLDRTYYVAQNVLICCANVLDR